MIAATRPLRILQVSTSDVAGGAERSAKNLAGAFRALGHESWLAVGTRREDDQYTFAIPNDEQRNGIVRAIDDLRRNPNGVIHRVRGLGRLTSLARRIAEPSRMLDVMRGREDFHFPGTARLLELPPVTPDIVHVHNLHGGYFDLEALPELSRRVPTVLNVRDAWLMSGHCAFSLDCERWKTGCGNCPDLTLFPAVARDATAFNWQRKRAILAGSSLYVATPSEWMMNRVRESIVALGATGTRVIPNGVDTRTFRPGNRAAARASIGIDPAAMVLLVAANGLRFNVWKDYKTVRAALEILGARTWPAPLIVLAVGDDAPPERIGNLELRFVPFEAKSERLAEYYRAADLYLHAARVESFGNVLLEARACGTPIVATAVGGIPEQVRALACEWAPRTLPQHGISEATGVLVPEGDATAFAGAVAMLIEQPEMRATLAENGRRQVHEELSLEVQAERFVDWYREILAQPRTEARHATA